MWDPDYSNELGRRNKGEGKSKLGGNRRSEKGKIAI